MTIPAQSASAILSPEGRLLSVTPGDRLWLLRAVEAEGPPRDLVAQTLVNRWAYLADRRPGLYPTLGSLVQAYAQPVNPAWYPTGRKHLAALERGQDTPERAAARRDVHSARTEFSAVTQAAVHQALRGPVTLPKGAVHYSVPRDTEEWRALELVPGEIGTSNAIYTARGAEGALYAIPSRSRGAGGRAAGLLAVLALGGALVGAVYVTRNKKGGRVNDRPGSDQEAMLTPAFSTYHSLSKQRRQP